MTIPAMVTITLHSGTVKMIEKLHLLRRKINAERDPSGDPHVNSIELEELTNSIAKRLGYAALEAIDDGANSIYPG